MSDLIDRQAAIDALEHKKDKNAKGDIGGFYNKIIQNDIDALMQLPSAQPGCEDAVSRKAAIDALPYLLDYEGFKGESGYVSKNLVRTMLKGLPPVTPKQPGWIPCSERFPEEPFACQVTVWDTNPVTMDEFENVLPYFVGWDGEQWNDANGEQCPFEVIAWQPQPTPYREGGQDEQN